MDTVANEGGREQMIFWRRFSNYKVRELYYGQSYQWSSLFILIYTHKLGRDEKLSDSETFNPQFRLKCLLRPFFVSIRLHPVDLISFRMNSC